MGFCNNCGSYISDNALFCAKCGQPIAQGKAVAGPAYGPAGGANAGYGGVGGVPNVRGMPAGQATNPGPLPTVATHASQHDPVGIVQGVLAVVAGLIGCFAPVIQIGPLPGTGADISMSASMPTIVSLVLQGGKLMETMMRSMGGLQQPSEGMSMLNLAMIVLCILGLVSLAGVFVTAARRFEGTAKSSLVTGWLLLPYALMCVVVLMMALARINESTSPLMGSNGMADIIRITIWPWLVLIVSFACGVLGTIRELQKPKM